jgi:hypothetical protein
MRWAVVLGRERRRSTRRRLGRLFSHYEYHLLLAQLLRSRTFNAAAHFIVSALPPGYLSCRATSQRTTDLVSSPGEQCHSIYKRTISVAPKTLPLPVRRSCLCRRSTLAMKFCKNLQRVVDISDPEWAPYWTNYKMLKVSCKMNCRFDLGNTFDRDESASSLIKTCLSLKLLIGPLA